MKPPEGGDGCDLPEAGGRSDEVGDPARLRSRIRVLEQQNESLRAEQYSTEGPDPEGTGAGSSAAVAQARSGTNRTPSIANISVLIAEDEAFQQQILEALFKQCNVVQHKFLFSVSFANSAQAAMDILRSGQAFHLLLLKCDRLL